MTNTTKYFLISFLLLQHTFIIAASKIAVATKVRGLVEIVKANNDTKKILKTGTVLEDGDQILTGGSGYVALIFIDDKTILKIKENTDIIINGTRTASAISKRMQMENGTIRAKVTKQRKGDFEILTPTSVASVKGTDFFLTSDPFTGDLLFGIEGLINFTNLLSGFSIDITAGLMGNSNPDGTVVVTEIDPTLIPEDPDEIETDEESELRIIFENEEGEQKTLIINYQ